MSTRIIDNEPHEDIDPNDLLSTNAFVPTLHREDLYDKQKRDFKNYYLSTVREEERRKVISTIREDQEDPYQEFANILTGPTDSSRVASKNTQDVKKTERISIIDVDTRNRNKNLYPTPSHFVLPMGQTFYNVKKIELVSTAIPNTDQVITDTPEQIRNNRISWENIEDIDLGIYINITVQNSPIANYVDVIIPNHGMASQQRINGRYITITKSDTTPSVDGERYVSIIDDDTLRFPFYGGIVATGNANVDTGYPTYTIELTPGNYNITTISAEIQKKLNLVKRRNQTSTQFHYFTVEANTDTDVITIRSYITQQLANNPLECSSGQGIITVNATSHGLKTNDYALIIGSKNLGGISSNLINGLHQVSIINSDVFTYEINERASEAAVGGGATVRVGRPTQFRLIFDIAKSLIVNHIGFPDEDSSEKIGDTETPINTKVIIPTSIQQVPSTDYIEITSNNHGLYQCNTIQISSVSQTPDGLLITTTTPHGLGLVKTGFIEYLHCEPPINKETSFEVFGDYTILLSNVQVSNITPGTGALKYGGDKIVFYNFRTNPENTNTSYFVEDATTNTFRVKVNFTYLPTDISDTVIGTQQVFVNHLNHGFNNIQSITDGGGNRALITTQTPHNLIGTKFLSCSYSTTVINTVGITTPSAHGLSTSDVVQISASTGTDINGDYYVQVVDATNFRITYIGGAPVSGTCNVNVGNTTVFTNTNSVPSIDTNNLGEIKYYVDVVDATSFYVDVGFTITTPGTRGILGRDQKVSIHRVVADKPGGDTIGGIPLSDINHSYHKIEQIVDENQYMIRVSGYATASYSGGGSEVVVSSQIHGYRVFQSNTYDGEETGVLYKSISLEGENYLYLVCNGLRAVYSPGNESLGDVFAKLLLSEPPGLMIFDGFISAPLEYNPPLAFINSFTFDFKRQDGYNFNFNNTDLSFSMRITEIVDAIDGTGISSRTGTSDIY